jgi:hypothetical protein
MTKSFFLKKIIMSTVITGQKKAPFTMITKKIPLPISPLPPFPPEEPPPVPDVAPLVALSPMPPSPAAAVCPRVESLSSHNQFKLDRYSHSTCCEIGSRLVAYHLFFHVHTNDIPSVSSKQQG